MEIIKEAEGALLLYYNPKAFVGVGFTGEKAKTYQYATTEEWASVTLKGRKVRARITNDRNVVTYHYSVDDGATWRLHPTRMEVAGAEPQCLWRVPQLAHQYLRVGHGECPVEQFFPSGEETR